MVRSGLLGLLLLGLLVTIISLLFLLIKSFSPYYDLHIMFNRSTLVLHANPILEVKKHLLVQTNGKDMVNAIK